MVVSLAGHPGPADKAKKKVIVSETTGEYLLHCSQKILMTAT
jgi:hypothetical protein